MQKEFNSEKYFCQVTEAILWGDPAGAFGEAASAPGRAANFRLTPIFLCAIKLS
jgi:hypothetical protein